MNKDYRHIGSPALRLIEECSELIKAIIKAEHFGYDKSKAFHKGQFKKAYCKEFWTYEVIETFSKQERLIKEIELEFKHEPKYNKRWQTK